MKKLSIVLLAVFFIGIANISAQTDTPTETVIAVEEVQEVKKDCPFTKTEDGKLICTKTGKICNPADCKKKSKCCKGKKSKKGSFNFNNSNNYGGKSSCSKKAKKGCGADCTKPCCVPPPPAEEVATEETPAEDTPDDE